MLEEELAIEADPEAEEHWKGKVNEWAVSQ